MPEILGMRPAPDETCAALAAERHAVGQSDEVAVEDDVADANVGTPALVDNLRHQVLRVHQLDDHRVAGGDVLELDPEPARRGTAA